VFTTSILDIVNTHRMRRFWVGYQKIGMVESKH